MSYKGSDVYRSGNTWSKVAEKLVFIQNGVYKYRYEKPVCISSGQESKSLSTTEIPEVDLVNYYHKALHLRCCSSPRSASKYTF